MYTSDYLKNKEIFEKLEIEFKKNPSSKTATKLAQARKEFNNTQKFTQKHLDYCDRENLKDLIETISFVNPNDIV